MMKTKKHYITYILSLLLFGMNGILASYILLNSYEIVFTRTLIGALLLLFIFLGTHRKPNLLKSKKHFIYTVISGASMGIGWIFLYEAYNQIGVSIATLAYYCGPVIVMVISPIVFKEKITWQKFLGFFAVLIGMCCINTQILSCEKNLWGIFCGMMSAVMYAAMVIFTKKAQSITGLENTMWQLTISFITAAVFLLIKQGASFHIEPASIIPMLILGIINTGIGCCFYFSSIDNLPVQTVSILGYIEPLSAVIFSVMFLNEKMSILQIIGGFMILGGAAFGELFYKKQPV